MPDHISSRYEHLQQPPSQWEDWPEDFIFPQYQGQAISNLPASICQWFGIPSPDYTQPFLPKIMDKAGNDIQKILVVLVDGLSFTRLTKWMEANPSLIWNKILQEGDLTPITSISPSTTSAAIPSAWTGITPLVHGIVGYEMWLREYGVVANMILHRPMSFQSPPDSLKQAGFNPKTYLPVPSLGEVLLKHKVPTHIFQHYSILDSGMSKMFMKGSNLHPFSTLSDLWISLRDLWEDTINQSLYTYIYWEAVDGLSHFHSPDDERPHAEFEWFSHGFEKLFLEQISAEARKGTLIVLMADHGQISTPNPAPQFELRSHPEFTNMLHIQPTGENRMAYLHLKPGKKNSVREYINTTWPDQFLILEIEKALDSGLFGPGKQHPQLLDRLGDLVVVSKGNSFLWWAEKKNPLRGRHGGLTIEEMIVPLLTARL
jgi:hypothetical protein